jgi:hypothetical protein
MSNKNHIEIEGVIASDIKTSLVGVKKNFPLVSFLLRSEGDPKVKKDGTTYTPKVTIAISAAGKLADSVAKFKMGDLLSIVGSLKLDKSEKYPLDARGNPDLTAKPTVTWYMKIEAISIEPLVVQTQFDDIDEMPF